MKKDTLGRGHPYRLKKVALSVGLVFSPLGFGLGLGTAVAQVVVAPNAPIQNQPGVGSTAGSNNVPVVNIVAPNGGGVSHNIYNQFNVNQQGLILNNSTINTNTHLGGYIQGNPNLSYGAARVILNEINSGNPSFLGGYIEVGGQRADVIIANPGGISIDGAGFINAAGVTLTTGTAQFNSWGGIEAYRVGGVGGGTITIGGAGLNASTTDYTTIISRAVQVNAGLWANDLTVAAGTGRFDTSGNVLEATTEDPGSKPAFAIDVAALGGMYSGKIKLIGTEAGVGVRNAGQIGASAGEVRITADGQLINAGQISSSSGNSGNNAGIQIAMAGDISNLGTIYSDSSANIQSATVLTNTGTLAAQDNLTINAQTLDNQSDALIAAGVNSNGSLNTTGNLNITASLQLTNDGIILAGNHASIIADSLNNTVDGEIVGQKSLHMDVDNTLTNRGLIDGAGVLVKTDPLDNVGTGRIYGNQLAIVAQQINNRDETVNIQTSAAVIAAREQLHVGVQNLNNVNNALIYSGGDIAIGGALDANNQATGSATLITNDGAIIEAAGITGNGDITITAADVKNLNSAFATRQIVVDTQNKFTHDIPLGSMSWDNDDVIYIGEGSNGSYSYYAIGKGSDIASTIGLVGTSSNHFLLIPSSIYTKAQTDYVLSVGGLYEAGLVGGLPNLSAYAPDDAVWGVFGLTPPTAAPATPAVDCSVPATCSAAQQTIYDTYQSDLTQWQLDNTTAYWNLGLLIMDYNTDFVNRKVDAETLHQYTETQYSTEVTASNPGQILAAGNITINGKLTNENSQVMAGGTITADASSVNIATHGTDSVVREGTQVMTIRNAGGRTWYAAVDYAPYTVSSTQTNLGVSQYEQNASYSGTNNIGNISLPGMSGNALYQINPGTSSNYLIETDPRFTSYGTWLSSSYMLSALGFDPAVTQKRLGDGFYEQQLIREQVGQLTDYRFLAGYQSDEEMYQALMDAGVAFAEKFNITLGVELSAEQMSELTSDMVWLVSKDITLADGRIETVLVPQLYVKSGNTLINTDGTLISATNVVIGDTDLKNNENKSFTNSGTIAARETLIVSAQNITNEIGQLHGNDTYLQSTQDITNKGGVISADSSITIVAGRDFKQESTLFESTTQNHTVKDISNVAMVYLSGESTQNAQNTPDTQNGQDIEQGTNQGQSQNQSTSQNAGQLYIQAGRDIVNTGGVIINAAAATAADTTTEPEIEAAARGSSAATAATTASLPATILVAGNNIELQSLESSRSESFAYDARNKYDKQSTSQNASQIQAIGDITLVAGNQINVTGSHVESMDGDLYLSAKEVNIAAADTRDTAMGSAYTEQKGTMSYDDAQGLAGSSLGAKNIVIATTGDQNYTASSVIADENLTLVSTEGHINVSSRETHNTSLTYNKTKKSGVSSSGGFGVSVGKEQTTRTEYSASTNAQGTTLGSLEGDITISAQQGTYNQKGSDVLALTSDINIIAQDINIEEARETSTRIETYEYKKSGVTIGVSSPLIAMVQQAKQMDDASKRTSNSRMDALAAGAVALNVYNTVDSAQQILQGGNAGGGLTVSIGTQKAKSQNIETTDTGKASNVNAGGNVNLIATGDGQNTQSGNINIIGSTVEAQNDITIIANNQLNVKASQNTQTSLSQSKNSSLSVGATLGGTGLASVNVGASQGKGNGASLDQTWDTATVDAGGTLTVVTGGDTNLIGGQLIGEKIIADIGGDLNIQTLQDVSVSYSKQKNTSASLGYSVASPLPVSGSFNQSNASASGTYISANEYAGIMAGDGGFDITVDGNTALIGGIIASTQDAVDNNKNSLTTGTLTTQDLINVSSYDSKGSTIGGGISIGAGTPSATPPVALSGKDSGFDSSTTVVGISGGVITITDAEKQKEKTGQTVEETIESINTSVQTGMATGGVNKNWDSTDKMVDGMMADLEIAQAFTQAASTFVTNQAAKEAKKWEDIEAQIRNGKDSGTLSDLEIAALQSQVDQLKSEAVWSMGGGGRLVITAITAAIGGNVSGSAASMVQSAAVNVIQGLGAQAIKDYVDKYHAEDDMVRAALQGILACTGAMANSSDCGSAALGAAGSIVIGSIMGGTIIKDPQTGEMREMTQQEREDRQNLINTILAGTVEALGGDSAAASTAAQIEAENNQFAQGSTSQKEAWANPDLAMPNPSENMYTGAQTVIGGAQVVGQTLEGLAEIVYDPTNLIPGTVVVGAVVKVGDKVYEVVKATGKGKAVAKEIGSQADNIADAKRLANQLKMQSASSPFTSDGKLTQNVISNAKPVPGLGPGELNNPSIPKGFGKYTTETYQSPSGSFQIHFYKNPTTGEVLYDLDYKAIFNSMSGVQKK